MKFILSVVLLFLLTPAVQAIDVLPLFGTEWELGTNQVAWRVDSVSPNVANGNILSADVDVSTNHYAKVIGGIQHATRPVVVSYGWVDQGTGIAGWEVIHTTYGDWVPAEYPFSNSYPETLTVGNGLWTANTIGDHMVVQTYWQFWPNFEFASFGPYEMPDTRSGFIHVTETGEEVLEELPIDGPGDLGGLGN